MSTSPSCEACKGRGMIEVSGPIKAVCMRCHGTGVEPEPRPEPATARSRSIRLRVRLDDASSHGLVVETEDGRKVEDIVVIKISAEADAADLPDDAVECSMTWRAPLASMLRPATSA